MNIFTKYMLASSYLWVLSVGMLGPLYAVFAQDIGGSILDLTGAYAMYYLIAGLVTIWVGYKSDHLSKKKMMLIGYVIAIIATFGYLLVKTPLHLFIIQGIFGLASALSNPTWYALFSQNLEGTQTGFSWGLLEGGNNFMMGLAVFGGGLIVTAFGFQTLFIVMGCIMLFATIVQAQILRH